jgi:hypothetical protein
MLRVNPKYEIRITKTFFVDNAEPFAFAVGFENLSI